jgi:hypothetical protein
MPDFCMISQSYRAELRAMHGAGAWDNNESDYRYINDVIHLIWKIQAHTLLDYGCGSCRLKAMLKQIMPDQELNIVEYDPGVTGKDTLPSKPCDLVVCADVLEHVEPDDLGEVLNHIYELTGTLAYLAVATRPADKRLPSDRNAHLIIDNATWWHQQILKCPWDIVKIAELTQSEVIFWARKS